ncbi:MAG: hypothetical protein WC209_09225 [Ignavibacteriaceae bacterium]|jgi:hypothetical protein
MKTPIFLMLFIVSFVFNSNLISQINNENSFSSLSGIKEVNLVVNMQNGSGVNLLFSSDRIRLDFELKLRNAGFKVLKIFTNSDTLDIDKAIELVKMDNSPYLFLNIKIFLNFACPLKNWLISMDVYQKVKIKQNIKMHVSTWSLSSSGVVNEESTINLRDRINNIIDEFLNDYLKTNSK